MVVVGETQSPPGLTTNAFMSTISQARIRTSNRKKGHVIVLVTAKSKRVAILVVYTREDTLYYWFAGETDGYDLQSCDAIYYSTVPL